LIGFLGIMNLFARLSSAFFAFLSKFSDMTWIVINLKGRLEMLTKDFGDFLVGFWSRRCFIKRDPLFRKLIFYIKILSDDLIYVSNLMKKKTIRFFAEISILSSA